jgi:hypothetical protein
MASKTFCTITKLLSSLMDVLVCTAVPNKTKSSGWADGMCRRSYCRRLWQGQLQKRWNKTLKPRKNKSTNVAWINSWTDAGTTVTRGNKDFTVLPENQFTNIFELVSKCINMFQHSYRDICGVHLRQPRWAERTSRKFQCRVALRPDRLESHCKWNSGLQPRSAEGAGDTSMSQVAFGREHLFESICWGLQHLSTNFQHFFPRTTERSENFVAICCNEGWLALSCTVHEVRMKFEEVEDMPVQARTLTSCTMQA